MFTSTARRRRATTRPRILWRLGAVSVAAVAVLVACGDDEDPTTTIAPAVTTSTVTPTVEPAAGGDGY
jgi:hypothetical protein